MITFITGNKNKIMEAKRVLPDLSHLDIDLPEIQELDSKKIIEHKLKEAFKHAKGQFLVEDVSMYLDCFSGKLPGPLIKWFNESIGPKGLYEIGKRFKNNKAEAVTVIGYAKSPKKILFFEGRVKGRLVKPTGKYGFGYDTVFMPEGFKKTLSELKFAGDFSSSPRGHAFAKLKKYLEKK